MGNFCSREKEDFDESLNSELNEIVKRKPSGEEDEGVNGDVNFDDLMALKEKASGGGGCCGGGASAPKSLDASGDFSMKEIESMKKKREHFEKWSQKHVVGKEDYDESTGEKLFSQEYMAFLFSAAVFWMTVRTESYKIKSRVARRFALFGTDKPGGPKDDAPDPTPESIEKYRSIIQQTTQKDMEIIDDSLNAILAIGEIDQALFEKSWTLMSETEEGSMRQVHCYSSYDAVITPTLTEVQQQECNKLATQLTDEDAAELFTIKCRVQLEQAQDIQDTMKMMQGMPAETQALVAKQLDAARGLAVPMLADYIWWISAGKYEWVYLNNRLDAFIEKKQEEKDAEWLDAVKNFEQKLKDIQGIKEDEEKEEEEEQE